MSSIRKSLSNMTEITHGVHLRFTTVCVCLMSSISLLMSRRVTSCLLLGHVISKASIWSLATTECHAAQKTPNSSKKTKNGEYYLQPLKGERYGYIFFIHILQISGISWFSNQKEQEPIEELMLQWQILVEFKKGGIIDH